MDADVSVVGLIGHPVAHSVSPVFQQAAFDALGLPFRYEAWDTPEAALAATVASLRAGPRMGANVTVPHKQRVIPLLDEVDEAVRATGAANTIVRRDGRLLGANTDVSGFLDALRRDGGFEPGGATALVIGAGGAARAIVWALLEAGAAEVRVHNRTQARAAEVVRGLDRGDGRLQRATGSAGEAAAGCNLLVQCTTLGMAHTATEHEAPLTTEEIPTGCMAVDIVANPPETEFLRRARLRGCRTLGGLPMLVHQGAAAFTRWTGRPAPIDVMMSAARHATAG